MIKRECVELWLCRECVELLPKTLVDCPFLILKFFWHQLRIGFILYNVKMSTASLDEQLRTKERLLVALRKQRVNCTNRNATNEELHE